MTHFLNPPSDGFELILNGGFYVDKTDLIATVNAVMDTPQRFLCVTRPRRFGKTFAAQMLSAFYSQGADARRLFEPLRIFRHPAASFCLERLNRCNVLFLDMTHFILNPDGVEHTVERLQSDLLQDLTEAFPFINTTAATTVPTFLQAVHDTTDQRFFLIIDEWDLPFREVPENHSLHQQYRAFLQSLFDVPKTSRCFSGAYLTGIFPISFCCPSAVLSSVRESSMTISGDLAPFVGFTEDDIQRLCRSRSVDSKNMLRYGGYRVGNASPVYCPYSVTRAAFSGKFRDYWNRTETFELLRQSVDLPVDGLQAVIIELLNRRNHPLNLLHAVNGLSSPTTVDTVLARLVHLGYLTYDAELSSVMIPNEEVRTEFLRSCRHSCHAKLREAADPIP